MSIFKKITDRYKRITAKQFAMTGMFMLAFAAAVIGGFASKQYSSASTVRDCGYEGNGVYNSIDYKSVNGGCGALTPEELRLDVINNSGASDLQTIYADSRIGLTSDKYDRFANTAIQGVITKSGGNVIIDGEVVMTDVWTMGRTTLGGSQRTPIYIGGHTYYHSPTSVSFGPSQLDAMVMFDSEGTVEAVIMNSCGNPVTQGNKVKSGAECKTLNKVAVEGKENTYKFNTEVSKFGLAKFQKFEYFYNDGSGDKLFATTNSASEYVEKTFTKSADVTVKVTISLPGRQTKVITSELCKKHVGVVKKEVLSVCEALVATSVDNQTFRFTVTTKQSVGVTVKSADFTLDNTVTVKDVTTKDNDGKIYRDYTFTDENKHTVSVVVNFLVDGKVVQSKEACEASVTRNKTPECKPGIPVGDKRCEEMPVTGPAGTAGLFVGVSAAGAAIHRVFASRKARRSD